MRIRQAVLAVGAPLVLTALVSCGSSSTKAATATTARSSSGASSSGASASTATKSSGKADCAAVKDAIGGLVVNWQLVAQFQKETDVTKWPERASLIGTLAEFASQLDTLKTQLGGDAAAAKSIEYMQGANDIVQKGLAGDVAAPQALADYLGTDLVAVLSKQSAIGIAASGAGC